MLAVSRAALRKARGKAASVRAMGITNQRETVCHLGPQDGKTHSPCHRLAGPPNVGHVCEFEGRRP